MNGQRGRVNGLLMHRKTKRNSMLGALLGLAGLLALRLMVALFVPQSGILLYVGEAGYSFSKESILLGLWLLIGMPLCIISLNVLYEQRRRRE